MKVSDIASADAGGVIRVLAGITEIVYGDGAQYVILKLQDLTGWVKIYIGNPSQNVLDIVPSSVADITMTVCGDITKDNQVCTVVTDVNVIPRRDWDISAFMYTPLNQLNKLKQGDSVRTKVLIADRKTAYKKADFRDKEATVPYWTVVLQDRTHSVTSPVWTDYQYYSEYLQVGQVFEITGSINYYQDVPQIKDPVFTIIKDANPMDYIPSIEIPHQLFDYFNSIMESLKEPYKTFVSRAIGYNIEGLEDRWKAFVTAPGAVKHHHNKCGGLFIHTVGVLRRINDTIRDYVEEPFCYNASNVINPSRLRLKGILHDYMKTWEYLWKPSIKRRITKRDHTIMGVAYIVQINDELDGVLPDEEIEDICYSIMSHSGDNKEFSKWVPESAEDWILYLCDNIDAKIVGKAQNNENKQTVE